METRRGPGKELFARMATTEKWLVLATTGQKSAASQMFGKSSLLEVLRERVERACNGEECTTAGDEAAAEAEHDPMDDIDDAKQGDETPTRGGGAKRARYYRNHAKNHVLNLDLPSQPPEVVRDCREKRSIQLWIMDRRQVWLRMSDVPWAVKYLYIQGLLKGVPLVAPESEGPSGSSPSELASASPA